MEDECPFQLGDFFVKHYNFPGCIAICLDECILCFAPLEVLDKRALALVFPARLRPPSRPWSEIPGDQQQ